MSKVIYSGLESSGKSLKLAMVSLGLLERNRRWFLRSGLIRTIASNLEFSKEFEDKANQYGIPIVYWKDIDDLVTFENCDVIIDEVGNYFDARMWQDLSLDLRRWLTQGAKCGVEIYGSAQDFAQVDKSFRRLVNELYHIKKVIGSPRPSATKPPIKSIWGLCLMRQLDPVGYEEDNFKAVSILPSVFLIRKKYCEIFNTNQKIVRSNPPPLRHIMRKCGQEGCDFCKIQHL